jgi:hypothetical protein
VPVSESDRVTVQLSAKSDFLLFSFLHLKYRYRIDIGDIFKQYIIGIGLAINKAN